MPTDKSYGVEAEFLGVHRNDAVEALRDYGLAAENDGYHHERRPYWRVTEDGSVNGEGNELVSPVLGRTTTAHTTQLKTAVKALREAGGVVDVSCGLHIHHSLTGKDVEDAAQAAAYYTLFQSTIDTVLPASRVGHGATSYCAPMGSTPLEWLRGVRNVSHLRSDSMYNFGRYHGVNLNAAPQHGTLEFRQHSGTLNATKIANWTKFTRLFMDLRKNNVMPVEDYMAQGDIAHTIEDVIRHLAGDSDRRRLRPMVNFYNDRARTFARADADDEDVSNNGRDFGHAERSEDDDDEEGNWCDSCGTYHYDE